MKTILWLGTALRADPEEREARRPLGRDAYAFSIMLDEYEQLTKLADRLGIEAIGSTEHHLHIEGGETLPNPLLLFAKLAAVTENIIFMPLSNVLPAHDPIRLAEDLALFDQLYPGRMQVSLARGYQTRWVQTLTQREKIVSSPMDPEPDTNSREVFNEHLEVLEKAWAEDSWSYEGKHYQAPFPASGIPNWPAAEWTRRYGSPGDVDDEGTLHKIGVMPKPLSPPRVFVPYVMSKKTLIDAARRGHSVLVLDSDKDRFRASCELYRDEARKAGRDLELGQNVGAVRKMFLGDSYEEAFELAVKYVGFWHYNFFGPFGMNESYRAATDDPQKMVHFDSARDLVQRMVDVGNLLCGTPEQVLEQAQDIRRCYSDGNLEWLTWEFWGQGAPGDFKYEIPTRQLELYAKHVKPYLA